MNMEEQLFQSRVDLSGLQQAVTNIKQEMAKFIIGQDEMVELLLEHPEVGRVTLERVGQIGRLGVIPTVRACAVGDRQVGDPVVVVRAVVGGHVRLP